MFVSVAKIHTGQKLPGYKEVIKFKKTIEFLLNSKSHYFRATDVGRKNVSYGEQLFDYGNVIRKIMCPAKAVYNSRSNLRTINRVGDE